MSRVGRQPIPVPEGVTITVESGSVTVEGPRGTLEQAVNRELTIAVSDGHVVVSRQSEAREQRALHGLTRALVANMVTGVTEGFQKTLELVGVGYRAQESGGGVVLQVGFSHSVDVPALEGTALNVEGNNRIHVIGIDKQRVGEMAARIRAIRPPNAYTGKGIRYLGERVKLKPGKGAGRSR